MKMFLTLVLGVLSLNSFACKDVTVCSSAFGDQVERCLGSQADFKSRSGEVYSVDNDLVKVISVTQSCGRLEETFVVMLESNGVTKPFICRDVFACE